MDLLIKSPAMGTKYQGAGNPSTAPNPIYVPTDKYVNETTGEVFTCYANESYGVSWAGTQGTVLDADILNPANANLLAMYTMDNISGSTLIDESGGNNGTITGAVSIAGKIGNALSFDGIDDFVSSSAFTNSEGGISLWIKPVAGGLTNKTMFGRANSAIDNQLTLFQYTSDGTDRFRVLWVDTPSADEVYTPNSSLIVDGATWSHVVFNASSSGWEVYINGIVQPLTVSLGTNSGKLFDVIAGSEPALLMRLLAASTDSYADGALDQFRFFNRILTSNETATLYAEGI